MDAFIGTINAKMDVKGRAFVPASFRKILQSAGESRLILQEDVYKNCLILYPESSWKEKSDKLRSRLNEWNEEDQELLRYFLYSVEILELDSNGRILIPKKYLQWANITTAICFVGMTLNIELWNPGLLIKSMLSADDFRSRVKNKLASKLANEKME